MEEVWKEIPCHKNYQASNFGRIRQVSESARAPAFAVIAQSIVHGYKVANIRENGRFVQHKVHRLVAMAWLPVPEEGRNLVAHNDGSRDNNRPDNLRWATCKENLADRKVHGTEIRGAKNGRSKLSINQVIEIRRRYKKRDPIDGAAAMAREFGVSDCAIIFAYNGKNWSHLTESDS